MYIRSVASGQGDLTIVATLRQYLNIICTQLSIIYLEIAENTGTSAVGVASRLLAQIERNRILADAVSQRSGRLGNCCHHVRLFHAVDEYL